MARLKLVGLGNIEGSDFLFPLGADEMDIGRNKTNYVFVDDPYASRFHCKIVRMDSRYHVVDVGNMGVGSNNGTFVNETPVGALDDVVLEEGDILKIGKTRFKIGFEDGTKI